MRVRPLFISLLSRSDRTKKYIENAISHLILDEFDSKFANNTDVYKVNLRNSFVFIEIRVSIQTSLSLSLSSMSSPKRSRQIFEILYVRQF